MSFGNNPKFAGFFMSLNFYKRDFSHTYTNEPGIITQLTGHLLNYSLLLFIFAVWSMHNFRTKTSNNFSVNFNDSWEISC